MACDNIPVSDGGWNLKLEDSDKIHARLERLLNCLKPHSDDDADYHFFE